MQVVEYKYKPENISSFIFFHHTDFQVVEYQYKPEYLARFTAGEREKMDKRQTGVIAQVVLYLHHNMFNLRHYEFVSLIYIAALLLQDGTITKINS